AARISAAPALDRVVVAVDPPATASGDACGIVVAGRSGESAYVLADWSVAGASPAVWGARAVAAYEEFGADRLVVETNQGGDMVRAVLSQIDKGLAIREAHATRGKRLRAEPVAALYERGRVRHVGAFAALEDEMTRFTGAKGENSPDRLDALVWALTDLLLRGETAPRMRTL
ncbi:MAG: ATP-binding protein, partial [Parvularculaceae bacterium]|nr:ATP-binding protein [Parvularculaceae bacterium]